MFDENDQERKGILQWNIHIFLMRYLNNFHVNLLYRQMFCCKANCAAVYYKTYYEKLFFLYFIRYSACQEMNLVIFTDSSIAQYL